MAVDAEGVQSSAARPATSTDGVAPTTVLFALTSLVGAGLLFVVQPLVARLVLPHFGGSATVWSTSSLFFQVLLLVGYLYVHVSTLRLGGRKQPLLHLAFLLLPLTVLPVALPDEVRPDPAASPIPWLLLTLAMMIGLPFVVISTTGPLLQRWYSWTGNRRAGDPYFLFATSNLGSFGGLLAYPFLVEPFLTVDQQRLWWSWAFVGFVILMCSCGVVAWRSAPATAATGHTAGAAPPASQLPADSRTTTSGPSRTIVASWLALAFLPSSLMLGVTSHISTDVAAIPLMWVVPLAIYLATFVVAFARRSRAVPTRWFRVSAFLAFAAAGAFLLSGRLPIWLVIAIDLGLLLTSAFGAHARLAAMRPDPTHLTFFYLVVAAGGALGGLLNGVVAPVVFNWVWEYPLAIVGAALLGVGYGVPTSAFLSRRYHPAFVVFVEAAIGFIAVAGATAIAGAGIGGPLATTLAVGLGGVVAWRIARRPVSAAIAVALVVALPLFIGDSVLLRERTFYGSYTVRESNGVRLFTHGTTLHGQQSLGADSLEPRTYYAESGPVGSAFRVMVEPASVGVVGLGVGTIAAYGQPEQAMTFFEIDPAVVSIASDPRFFTFLSDSPAEIEHVVGDGRLMLDQEEAGRFDMLFLDAFTSDAIPVHLLTTQAFDVYAEALDSNGLLMVHVSNRVFDLEPVVGAAADHLGWHGAMGVGARNEDTGGSATEWIALARDQLLIEQLMQEDPMWRPLEARRVTWTDDFSSVLRVMR